MSSSSEALQELLNLKKDIEKDLEEKEIKNHSNYY